MGRNSRKNFDIEFKNSDELNKFKDEHPEKYLKLKRILITHQNMNLVTTDGKYIEYEGSKYLRRRLNLIYLLLLFIGLTTIYNGLDRIGILEIFSTIMTIIAFTVLVKDFIKYIKEN